MRSYSKDRRREKLLRVLGTMPLIAIQILAMIYLPRRPIVGGLILLALLVILIAFIADLMSEPRRANGEVPQPFKIDADRVASPPR